MSQNPYKLKLQRSGLRESFKNESTEQEEDNIGKQSFSLYCILQVLWLALSHRVLTQSLVTITFSHPPVTLSHREVTP